MWTTGTLTLLAGILLFGIVNSQDCGSGWFGEDGQYKCRCRSGNCDINNGTCIEEDQSCCRGWFGPACQYQDLVQGGNVTQDNGRDLTKLSDADDNTCITNPILHSVTITLASPSPFTWMRLVVQDTRALQMFNVHFKHETSSSNVDCTNRRDSYFNNKTLDIHCELSVTVQEVLLTGDGAASLCSVYVSGGRNVALKQNSTQSTTALSSAIRGTKYPYKAEGAVDGVIQPPKTLYYECSSTKRAPDADSDPSWSVTLSRTQLINRYVIYHSKYDSFSDLRGFTLTSYDEHGTVVFNHTDTETSAQDMYNIASPPPGQVISRVQINGIVRDRRGIVNLCEVEIYGGKGLESRT